MATVFVISDLHLGGRADPSPSEGGPAGSRINYSYDHLTAFIDWIGSGKAAEGPIELVLNGDIVDFLLIDKANNGSPAPWTLDEGDVIRRLDAIVESTREGRQDGPFDALARFCSVDGHSLVLLIGNHDLELSLPAVRRHLTKCVLGGSPRVSFIYDNEAYCRGDLLIEHGNRYDWMNAVNHDDLRGERSALSRGENRGLQFCPGGRFSPPAGSILVTELFNPLKETYRFLDLLKPEMGAVVPLMLALEPKASGLIAPAIEMAKAYTRGAAGRRVTGEAVDRGYISAANSASMNLAGMLTDMLGADAEGFDLPASGMISAADNWAQIQTLKQRATEWVLGIDNDLLKGRNRKNLKVAMAKLAMDKTFVLDQEFEPYLSEVRRLVNSGRFSTVVFGHTHLPKQVRIDRPAPLPPAMYLNTGTWADVMHVPVEVIGDSPGAERALDDFLADLAANKLDRTRYLTYARIELHNEEVKDAVIKSFCGTSQPDAAPLTPPHPEPNGA